MELFGDDVDGTAVSRDLDRSLPAGDRVVMSTATNVRSGSFHPFADDKIQLLKRQNEQLCVYLFVAAALVTAWLLGIYNFSFFWVFVIAAVTFFIWQSKVLLLTEYFLRRCEVLVHRRRALCQHETAEWLNFVINRWYAEDYYL